MKEFVYFTTSGLIAALVNLFTRVIFSNFFPFSVSIVLAYICGMITAYILFKIIFNHKKRYLKSALRFSIVNGLAILITLTTSIAVLNILNDLNVEFILASNEVIAHSLGVIAPLIPSFIFHKYFTYN